MSNVRQHKFIIIEGNEFHYIVIDYTGESDYNAQVADIVANSEGTLQDSGEYQNLGEIET